MSDAVKAAKGMATDTMDAAVKAKHRGRFVVVFARKRFGGSVFLLLFFFFFFFFILGPFVFVVNKQTN